LRDFAKYSRVFGPPENHGQIAHPRLTPDGQTLIFGIPSGGILAAVDVESGAVLYHAKKYSGNLYDIVVGQDGSLVLTASSDSTARLFDTRTGAVRGPTLVHTGTVMDADIAEDGWRVATREGSTVRIWDTPTGDLLARLPLVPKDTGPLWFSRDGQRIILSANERAFTWRLPRLEVPEDHVPALVRLLTGLDIDEANGLRQMDQFTLLNDPTPYRKAWLAWRGVADDPRLQP
jgi:WD40 repeat protein